MVKDNIAVAQVPMILGTKVIEGFVPQIDATVVTRALDAGAILVGKATCENLSASANSFSSASGYIDNPYAKGYSSGGSSSGCGRLLADKMVDLAIGGDQGGSVRIPSSFCGLVGLKPTYGLVPYSGIASLEPTIDHTGPMTKTVMDNALLLEAIAGLDGMDDRQVGTPSVTQVPHYSELLKSSSGLKGTRIALLQEGFNIVTMQPSVATKVREAILKFTKLGATVEEVSMPMHLQAGTIWAVATRASTGQGLLANPIGRRQLYMTELIEKFHPLTQDMVNAMFPSAVNMILNGLYLDEKYGSPLYAKAMNLVRKLRDEYDAILAKYDVIMLPTLPFPANRHAEASASPLEKMSKSVGLTLNTAPFNCSGHPALSLPCGFVPAVDNREIMLPCGLQIVGKAFDEITIYKFAHAWEQANNWKIE